MTKSNQETTLRRQVHQATAFFLAELNLAITYRASFFLSFLAELVQVFVLLNLWQAVFREQSIVAGFTYPMMLTYLLVSQAINMTYSFKNDASRIVGWQIHQGTIAQQLIRPVSYLGARLAENLGQTLVQVVLSFGALGLLACFLPGFQAPASAWHLLCFFLSVITGYFIMFSVSYMTGLTSFWLMNNWGVRNAKTALISFLSGALVPLDVLPPWLQRALNYLPFKDIVYTPTMIYMGQYQAWDLGRALLLQVFWALVFLGLAQSLTHLAVKRVSINGG